MKFFLVFLLGFMVSTAKSFDWQGHRGCRGLYPENTIGAMLKALKYKITTLEMDVVISRDQQVVVSHEPWMSQEICTDSKGNMVKDKDYNLFKMDYAEIAKFDCGMKMHPRFLSQEKVKATKPKLVDLIDEVEKNLTEDKKNIPYSIEIKSTPEDEKAGFQPGFKVFTDLVMKTILNKLPIDRIYIQSFDWRVLNYLHKQYPKVKTVALIEEKYNVKTVLKKLDFTPTVFSPDFELLTKEDVEFLHSKKILVIPWTVNTVEEMKKMQAIGVDGLITDYPDRINL